MKIRKGQLKVTLSETEFKKRYLEQFFDPAFAGVADELAKVSQVAWEAYIDYRKAPRTKPAGPTFKKPKYDMSVEWYGTHVALKKAETARKKANKSRVLIICGSPRNDQTCPGEMSKTFRLAKIAERNILRSGFETEFLDLSRITAEYGKKIYPCKACVSSAMPLCHWPCSCYPNHAVGQTQDWMAEIYEMWVRAHGVMIITPVHWYQSPSALKLMMDRLVCADGGNADPTTTDGKNVKLAKEIEIKGWDYPKHLKGRAFSVVVHGDSAGDETLRRSIVDWLHDMELIDSGPMAEINRYVGYFEEYAKSHDALDKDTKFQKETAIAAEALVARVKQIRSGKYIEPAKGLAEPRQK